ncbi:hypothetical protein OYB09_24355, partial [Escherichia coli]|nr:hypothetical protein [Escherichia coli]MED8638194.1 hypothetical protein [Escherichia coli]
MATRQRDKMYFWSTAGTPMTPGQVPPDTVCLLFFCYLFAISGAFEPFGCSPFAIFLLLFCYRTATTL